MLQAIEHLPGDNMPGIANAWLADVEDINVLPNPVNLEISTDITFSANGWYVVDFIKQSGAYSEDEQETRQGQRFNISIRGNMAKDSPEKSQSFDYLRNRKLVFLIQDLNGIIRLFGNKEEYITLTGSFNSGASGSESNQLALELRGQTSKEAPFYTGVISLAT